MFNEAFRDLSTCRAPDGPIPWTAMRLYARDKGFAPDVAEAVWAVIRQMDIAERRWMVENMPGAEEGGGGG